MNMSISELLPPKRKKKGTYLLKCECQSCGYIARVTAKWIDQAGEPICPQDQEPMVCQ